MNGSKANQLVREDIAEWTTLVSGDNGVEILEHRVRVNNFAQAVDVANKVAPLVTQYESLDSEYTIRVNLSRWMVQINLSVPKGFWASGAQEKLAKSIAELTES